MPYDGLGLLNMLILCSCLVIPVVFVEVGLDLMWSGYIM